MKAAWVVGDTVYGGDTKLRIWLEERLQPYVLAVPMNQRIGLTHRADEVVASWPAEKWQHLSVPEVRRLLWWLVWQAPPTPEGVFSWSHWRRRHQARAKHFHIKRRVARFTS